MDLVSILVTLILVGVLLWLVNTYGGPYIAPPILKIINVVAVVVVILWLLSVFGVLPMMRNVKVGLRLPDGLRGLS